MFSGGLCLLANGGGSQPPPSMCNIDTLQCALAHIPIFIWLSHSLPTGPASQSVKLERETTCWISKAELLSKSCRNRYLCKKRKHHCQNALASLTHFSGQHFSSILFHVCITAPPTATVLPKVGPATRQNNSKTTALAAAAAWNVNYLDTLGSQAKGREKEGTLLGWKYSSSFVPGKYCFCRLSTLPLSLPFLHCVSGQPFPTRPTTATEATTKRTGREVLINFLLAASNNSSSSSTAIIIASYSALAGQLRTKHHHHHQKSRHFYDRFPSFHQHLIYCCWF